MTGARQHTVGTYTDRCCVCAVFYRRSSKRLELQWSVWNATLSFWQWLLAYVLLLSRGCRLLLDPAVSYCCFVPLLRMQCLVLNLSALRVRIVITYLHCEKHSKGIATSCDDRAADKAQCQMYISNSLKVLTARKTPP